jgi:hypothetical protein
MVRLLTLALVLSGCAMLRPRAVADPRIIPIAVHNNNRSDVDVYLLCGEVDAEWLGLVEEKRDSLFRVPSDRTRCARGVNFFVVARDQERGYWVGPVRPRPGAGIDLTIEKYAALSTAVTLD